MIVNKQNNTAFNEFTLSPAISFEERAPQTYDEIIAMNSRRRDKPRRPKA